MLTVEYLKAFHVFSPLHQWTDQKKSRFGSGPQVARWREKNLIAQNLPLSPAWGHPIPFDDYLVQYLRGVTELLDTVGMETKQDLYNSPYNCFCSCWLYEYKNAYIHTCIHTLQNT